MECIVPRKACMTKSAIRDQKCLFPHKDGADHIYLLRPQVQEWQLPYSTWRMQCCFTEGTLLPTVFCLKVQQKDRHKDLEMFTKTTDF
jgi:hypothetical protein